MRTIPEKESLTIEFKSDRSGYSDADLVDEIVGMANTQGGDLYLGVEDDGEITGVGKKRQDPVGAMALIANKTIPSVSVRAEIIEEEGLSVLKIEIPMFFLHYLLRLMVCLTLKQRENPILVFWKLIWIQSF